MTPVVHGSDAAIARLNPGFAAAVLPVSATFYGGQDAGIPLDTVETMRDAIKAAKKSAEIVVYPHAQHGFNAEYRPNYDAAAASDAWKKMLASFQQHGV